jgi:transposase
VSRFFCPAQGPKRPQGGILIKARSVASIRSILKNGLDRAFLDETPDHQPLRHGNIRGQGYFH